MFGRKRSSRGRATVIMGGSPEPDSRWLALSFAQARGHRMQVTTSTRLTEAAMSKHGGPAVQLLS